jgi:cytochrome c peroxidase
MKSTFKFTCILSLVLLFTGCKEESPIETSLSKVQVGKLIFFDSNLSNPIGQSCASCHNSNVAFTDPNHSDISPGVVDGLFGNRNAPTVSYSKYSPALYYSNTDSTYIGGLFWDGRANDLKEQAQKPFFNQLEMNNLDLNMLVQKVKSASYYISFLKIYGEANDQRTFLNNVADAIATFESSDEVNPFTSKFDYFIQGKVALSASEMSGMKLFKDTLKAKCANCHNINPDNQSGRILFTDFSYDNIGVPKNKFNPFYQMEAQYNSDGASFVDLGLFKTTGLQENKGQFKVPTLRNIAITAPYFHNGVYASLKEVVHFYNKRDVDPLIGTPEVPDNVNKEELGDLKLTDAEELQIVEFLNTLTDGYSVKNSSSISSIKDVKVKRSGLDFPTHRKLVYN